MKDIVKDLECEQDALDAMVSGLSQEDWDRVTPFYGWTVRDEVTHLAFFDLAGRLAATDKDAFDAQTRELFEGIADEDGLHGKVLAKGRGKTKEQILGWWREERAAMNRALAALGPKDRLPWYGPTMSARSFATARLMETWAHGQDVADALQIARPATGRLIHVAHIGFITFGWSFANRGLEVPAEAIRLDLTGPSGEAWVFGPEQSGNVVEGTALDFCLVATQRRNLADTKLLVRGDVAERWMRIAQTFAGPPADGPAPGRRGA
ncbi:MAG: TIGR03084 family metal-binding protein [Thermodesulfobacteriota bacterium]